MITIYYWFEGVPSSVKIMTKTNSQEWADKLIEMLHKDSPFTYFTRSTNESH